MAIFDAVIITVIERQKVLTIRRFLFTIWFSVSHWDNFTLIFARINGLEFGKPKFQYNSDFFYCFWSILIRKQMPAWIWYFTNFFFLWKIMRIFLHSIRLIWCEVGNSKFIMIALMRLFPFVSGTMWTTKSVCVFTLMSRILSHVHRIWMLAFGNAALFMGM